MFFEILKLFLPRQNHPKLKDTNKHQGLRNQLVKQLEEKGITDKNVLAAIGKIPRHLFLDSSFENFAYQDKAFPIEAGQTISQPYTVAYQTQLLQVHEGDKILEIGTGSGYQTAVLVHMKAMVYTIERQKELVDFSKEIFKKIHIKPHYQTYGDGYKGLPIFAPFDKILVTAGAPTISQDLLDQLKIGGVLVIPVGDREKQKMMRYRKHQGKVVGESFDSFSFVPLLGDQGWRP